MTAFGMAGQIPSLMKLTIRTEEQIIGILQSMRPGAKCAGNPARPPFRQPEMGVQMRDCLALPPR